jgi:hypothetical protein
MKVNVIFIDWVKDGKSIYDTPEGIELSMGSLHGGSTWSGEINFDPDTEEELKNAGKAQAVFIIEPKED